jgi:hypothetical protein
MRVAEGIDGDTGEHIQVSGALCSIEVHPLAPGDLEGEAFVGVEECCGFALKQAHGNLLSKIVLA